MAKRRKKPSPKGCPEPLSTMIDLAGVAAMGTFAKQKIKSDHRAQVSGPSDMSAYNLLALMENLKQA